MTIYGWLIIAFWLVLTFFWIVSAVSAKRTLSGGGWRGHLWICVGVAVLIVLALRLPGARQALRGARFHVVQTNPAMGVAGVAICAAGVGFAIWARVHLGRNWGMPMSRKEDPDLVTTGPYAFVRHPIYTGILVATVGSAIGVSLVWLLPLVLFAVYFVYSARREETLMLAQFPAQYPAYMARTKMLIPFVL